MADKLRIFIADDHPLFRQGLRQVIDSEPELDVVGEAGDGEVALELIERLLPDVAILDISMPRINGVALVERLRQLNIHVDIIFLTVYREQRLFRHALELGVKGYVLKDSVASDIVSCVRAVAASQNFTSPELTTYLVRDNQKGLAAALEYQNLTTMERRILGLIAEYKTSQEIANELNISRRTVETHRAHISQKLDLRGSHALIRFALENKAPLI
jgi:DNA-binding NarL/FixJ family response regulator